MRSFTAVLQFNYVAINHNALKSQSFTFWKCFVMNNIMEISLVILFLNEFFNDALECF